MSWSRKTFCFNYVLQMKLLLIKHLKDSLICSLSIIINKQMYIMINHHANFNIHVLFWIFNINIQSSQQTYKLKKNNSLYYFRNSIRHKTKYFCIMTSVYLTLVHMSCIVTIEQNKTFYILLLYTIQKTEEQSYSSFSLYNGSLAFALSWVPNFTNRIQIPYL